MRRLSQGELHGIYADSPHLRYVVSTVTTLSDETGQRGHALSTLSIVTCWHSSHFSFASIVTRLFFRFTTLPAAIQTFLTLGLINIIVCFFCPPHKQHEPYSREKNIWYSCLIKTEGRRKEESKRQRRNTGDKKKRKKGWELVSSQMLRQWLYYHNKTLGIDPLYNEWITSSCRNKESPVYLTVKHLPRY